MVGGVTGVTQKIGTPTKAPSLEQSPVKSLWRFPVQNPEPFLWQARAQVPVPFPQQAQGQDQVPSLLQDRV